MQSKGSHSHKNGEPVSAALAARDQLESLVAERHMALSCGMDLCPDALVARDYVLAQLDDDIEMAHSAFVGSAVTEIASLRAELFGRQRG